ncbi:DUF2062 domain-containing protein [Sphingomonas sp. HF-S4]|uniref:DUF2062 domain-containing protein n=1 Tax=Sphingomonas agrestis TaxID=3080540 RepID=A0ABU3Y4P6_9SPHN|nr:DUF2062 domain-containing protein [Sphingomonas sp. HF-S4]MDV3456379.1 DUF2062 domain-containing protein [Sphingomonas sp. HF-S4]
MAERGLGPRFRAWVDRNLPTRESFESNKWLKPVAHRILHSSLWRMTRRSIPRGVALGMFTGILIPMGQIPASAVLALPLRANVPAAALTTFFTNPFTTPFLFILYYKVGGWVLHLTGTSPAEATTAVADSGWLHWLAADVGLPTAVGMFLCSVIGGILGYVVAALGWRLWITRKWRKRQVERAERQIDAA